MASGLIIIPNYMPALDSNGRPLSGALMYFYQDGTTTPQAVYSDEALSTALTNPVEADASGVYPAIYGDASLAYTVAVTTSAGAPLASYEGVTPASLTSVPDSVFLSKIASATKVIYPAFVTDTFTSEARAINDALLTAAVATCDARGGGIIQYPPGAVNHGNTTFSIHDNTTIRGYGRGSSFIAPSNTTTDFLKWTPLGLNVNVQRGGLKDLTIYHTGDPTAGALVRLDRLYHAAFSDCEIVGGFGGLWLESAVHNSFANVDIAADAQFAARRIGSYLCKLSQRSGSAVPAENHFVNCDWRGQGGNNRLDYSLLYNEGDGNWFTNCHFGFCGAAAVACLPSTNSSVCAGLYLRNTYLDTVTTGTGFLVVEPSSSYGGLCGGHSLDAVTVYNCVVGLNWNCKTNYPSTISGGLWTTMTTHAAQITKGQNIYIRDLVARELNTSNTTGHGVLIDGGANVSMIEIKAVTVAKGDGAYAPTSGIYTTAGATKVVAKGLVLDQCAVDIQRGDTDTSAFFEIARSSNDIPTYSADGAGALFLVPGYALYKLGTANPVTTITSSGFKGQIVRLIAQGNVTVNDGSNLKLASSYAMTADDTLTLMFDGTNYVEMSRSVN